MTIQVTVRLPDELVAFMDDQVAGEKARSRADVVTRALRRELRRQTVMRDAEIYASTEPDPDMNALAQWASKHPVPIDDDL